MENLDEQLKLHICSILNTVSEETVSGIIHALKQAGLESLSDLQFVQEEDLILFLKPIQRRKLVKAWSELSTNDKNLSGIAAASVSSYSPLAQNTSITTNSEFIAPPYPPSWKNAGVSEDGWTITSQSNDDRYPLEIPSQLKREKSDGVKSFRPKPQNWYTNGSDDDSSSEYSEVETALTERSAVSSRESNFGGNNELSHTFRNTPPTSPDQECLVEAIKKLNTNVIFDAKQLDAKEAGGQINGIVAEYESVTFPVTVPNNSPVRSSKGKAKELRKQKQKLLEIYAKYKRNFSDSTEKEQMVWKKIANEFRELCSVDYDELKCRSKINQLRQEYELEKNNYVTSKATALFLDAARKCFEATENQIKVPFKLSKNVMLERRKNKERANEFRLNLLKAYTKHKAEFASPDIEELKVWTKIATEIRKACYFECGAYLCQFKIFQMKRQYERLVSGKTIAQNKLDFYEEARTAFENADTLDYKVDKVENKIGKCMPPHLRNTENKLDETTISSKTIDISNTVKVSNLSNDVRASDLQELFMSFGTIAQLYTIKSESDESKRCAYITFLKQADAFQAILAVDGIEFNKLILKVEWAGSLQTDENFNV